MCLINMRKIVSQFIKTLNGIAFPQVCSCCSNQLYSDDRYICDLCLLERFEPADTSKDEILPEFVDFLFTMWIFDKGGYLQQLMHKLKYEFLKGVGVELGIQLGRSFRQSGIFKNNSVDEKWMIIPVPLHHKKRRKRGYNQARSLAEGFAKNTGYTIAEEGLVIRTRYTTTQTGLSTSERSKNVKQAFMVTEPEKLKGIKTIIIDDVYTTGATTFELARIITEITEEKTGIVTVAKA